MLVQKLPVLRDEIEAKDKMGQGEGTEEVALCNVLRCHTVVLEVKGWCVGWLVGWLVEVAVVFDPVASELSCFF